MTLPRNFKSHKKSEENDMSITRKNETSLFGKKKLLSQNTQFVKFVI